MARNRLGYRKNNPSALEAVGGCLLLTVIVAAIFAVPTWIFGFFWNIIAPVFNLPTLNFWQALAVVVVIGFLTGRLRYERKG